MSIDFFYFLCLLFFSLFFFMMSLKCMMNDCAILMEYLLVSLNSNNIMMTVLLDWMSLLFMSFVFFLFLLW